MTLDGKSVLVTGGTGSLGKILIRRLLSGELGTPSKVIVLSRDEAKQHEMRLSYMHQRVTTDEVIYRNFQQALEFRIGDVRDYHDVCSAIKSADVVINAAALKQVPTCEYFPEQAVLTNCVGAINIVRAIREHEIPVEMVIGVSTDKACKPVNVMGMTKAIQERIITSANVLIPDTRFMCVRYGNVLASRGSVIPLFHEQILNGGPVTITSTEMTRFLLSLDDAVETVFATLQHGNAGETYVPNVASATVPNIAAALIGDLSIEVTVTGIRPGEKIHEIMVSEEECHHTVKRGDYYVILPMLPELRSDEHRDANALDKEFSSADSVIDLKATEALLHSHRLLIGETRLSEGGELLA